MGKSAGDSTRACARALGQVSGRMYQGSHGEVVKTRLNFNFTVPTLFLNLALWKLVTIVSATLRNFGKTCGRRVRKRGVKSCNILKSCLKCMNTSLANCCGNLL